jgi:hypothetical protein
MIILEGTSMQRTDCSIEEVRGEVIGTISTNESQTWARISERAVKKGARKSMVGWLSQKAPESANKAAHALAQAAAAAKPQLQSASRTVLKAAGSASENLAMKLLGLSKAARIAALRSMPNAHIAQLVAELERDGMATSTSRAKPENSIVPVASRTRF